MVVIKNSRTESGLVDLKSRLYALERQLAGDDERLRGWYAKFLYSQFDTPPTARVAALKPIIKTLKALADCLQDTTYEEICGELALLQLRKEAAELLYKEIKDEEEKTRSLAHMGSNMEDSINWVRMFTSTNMKHFVNSKLHVDKLCV